MPVQKAEIIKILKDIILRDPNIGMEGIFSYLDLAVDSEVDARKNKKAKEVGALKEGIEAEIVSIAPSLVFGDIQASAAPSGFLVDAEPSVGARHDSPRQRLGTSPPEQKL